MLSVSNNEMRNRYLVASVQTALDSAQRSMDAIRALLPMGLETGGPTEVALDSVVSSVPRWHFAMLNDLERNDAFGVALERVVPKGAHVLDIGSGTGLLAMMVARAGAASVTTCEQNPMLAELARQIIAQHGLADVITVVPKRSMDLVVGVDLPRRADLIVSEIVDCGLIGEGVLPTVDHAREHLLAPGGLLLPESARVYGTVIDSVAVDRLNRVQFAGGFDVGMLNGLATRGHFPVRLSTWPHRMLSLTTELCSFDFATGDLTDGGVEAGLDVTETGKAHGLVVWFDLVLGGGIVLRNSPENLASHWMQAFVPFDEPIEVTAGERVRLDFGWRGQRLSASNINVSATARGMR
jgi:type II protein arginine methyltransferase